MSRNRSDGDSTKSVDSPSESLIAQIVSTLKGLRYGVVSIVVQDGVVVQIERTEKHRLRVNEL